MARSRIIYALTAVGILTVITLGTINAAASAAPESSANTVEQITDTVVYGIPGPDGNDVNEASGVYGIPGDDDFSGIDLGNDIIYPQTPEEASDGVIYGEYDDEESSDGVIYGEYDDEADGAITGEPVDDDSSDDSAITGEPVDQ